ncbi:hypothetical protein PHLGIDRAFT_366348 [Phlebiopsis gigantea 11061_1 CR5-6]|uniref:Uncharacterized protein n=1 Tax=Phlebiopsis gigantea (strain 11061_1 CR5-6) TaxID=745531 RepID=A0A0C3S9X6_PHLG1|nr:hypothetical protein PHLGIDRAFT_366348 [Phlebiopsis gigantea 11061_1 CR5-6]
MKRHCEAARDAGAPATGRGDADGGEAPLAEHGSQQPRPSGLRGAKGEAAALVREADTAGSGGAMTVGYSEDNESRKSCERPPGTVVGLCGRGGEMRTRCVGERLEVKPAALEVGEVVRPRRRGMASAALWSPKKSTYACGVRFVRVVLAFLPA